MLFKAFNDYQLFGIVYTKKQLSVCKDVSTLLNKVQSVEVSDTTEA